jgi:multicomponent K+:H+ antiporter subunit G
MTEPTLSAWVAIPAAILLMLGGIVALIGAIGLLRLKSFYARMHAPTMGATLGTGCVLLASMIVSSTVTHRAVFHELLIAAFLTMTAPVTAILLMRAARNRTGT